MALHRLALIACLLLLLAHPVAHGAESEPAPGSDAAQPTILAPAQQSRTRHELATGSRRLAYTATAGVLPVQVDTGKSQCTIFYVDYVADKPAEAQRPLTFVFNGGPGAASVYLHLGMLGPRRAVLGDARADTPATLADNPLSWLVFTDLVFVDPIGTGYSRCADPKPADGEQTRRPAEAQAWDVREDLAVLGRFIRLYLSRNARWASPLVLVGESYGGFRAAALTDVLRSGFGIDLAGVVLVSPALDFGILRGGSNSLLPWVVRLPSYAATARAHGKSTGDPRQTREAVQDVEQFALTRMLPALATGETGAVTPQLADFIGLPQARVAELHGRIPLGVFSRELLRDKGRIVSSYDGSWTAIDPGSRSHSAQGKDPLLVWLTLRLTAAFNSYVRKELAFETDIPYEILNARVARQWSWASGREGDQGYAEVASELKTGMSWNPGLKVLVAHGLFDLVTPYLGSVVVIRQLALDPQVAGNLTLKVYPGGHMFYTNEEARRRFFEDAQQFFATLAGAG
jgi:carboxypeptidase C (cathepsin A)